MRGRIKVFGWNDTSGVAIVLIHFESDVGAADVSAVKSVVNVREPTREEANLRSKRVSGYCNLLLAEPTVRQN